MEEKRITQMARRLGVTDVATLKKANELHRLYDSKSTFPINDVAKVVFSIECASMILDVQFDSGAAQKESTLTAKQYAHNMQNFRKALNLTKHVQVGDLCIHLELADNVKQVALKLLDEYRKQLRNENDIKEAHYVAMAVHQACKHWKVKGARIKSHLKQESRLESKQWGKLEETWAKWIEKEQPLLQKSKVLKDIDETAVETSAEGQEEKQPKPKVDRVLPYEEWKDYILKKANALIAQGGYE